MQEDPYPLNDGQQRLRIQVTPGRFRAVLPILRTLVQEAVIDMYSYDASLSRLEIRYTRGADTNNAQEEEGA